MPVDVNKMRMINPKSRKRKKKVAKNQLSFDFYKQSPVIQDYIDAEKIQKEENKNTLQRFKGKGVDWGKVSNIESPIFNYDVTVSQRSKYKAILKRGNSDKERKKLSKILGLEFARIYTKYRRQLQAADGETPNYQVHPKERRHARKAGELCIINGITPQTLLEYWDKNIRHFSTADLTIVPLTFAASASNVETVVKRGFAEQKQNEKHQDGKGHSFADVSQLEPMLRKKLEYAGFDTTTYNDRYLLSVQRTAKNMADGRTLFVPAEMKPMAQWIAENIYGG